MAFKKRTQTQSSNAFTDALKFVALICKDHGSINETHAHISNNQITAFNGVLSIGCVKIYNTLHACPQIKLALEALSKCGQNIAITQLDNRLSIKSDKFKAVIPCIANELLQTATPDEPCAIIDQRLLDAFALAIEDEDGEGIYSKTVLLNGNTLISSFAGKMIIEYWHGIDLPKGLVIPKALITPLSKINKKVNKFGFSQSSITFYFEDDSWIKSQTYAEQWPEIGHVFECKANLQPFPVDFWDALKAVAPFGEGLVYFRDGRLCSHATEGTGAVYELPGLQGAWCYPAKQLASLQAWASHVDFQAQGANGACLYAAGKQARAVMAGVAIPKPRQPVPYVAAQRCSMDDNIPF